MLIKVSKITVQFRRLEIKKKALLNNCGYVDNEQNNKIKELLISIENTDISISVKKFYSISTSEFRPFHMENSIYMGNILQ